MGDLRFALRQLSRSPVFTAAAALTLALGIGAATAIFSVADALFLRPLPWPHSDRLVMVWDELAKIGVRQLPLSARTFDAYRSSGAFDASAAFRQDSGVLILPGGAERVPLLMTTPGLLELTGARMEIGRSLVPEDWQPQRNGVALISHALFVRSFGSDPSIVGQTIRLADRAYAVAGVLARDFQFGVEPSGADIWLPLPPVTDPGRWQFRMLARLRPGTNIQTARMAVAAAARHVEEAEHPYRGPNGEDAGYGAIVVPLREQLFGDQRMGTQILAGATGLLLFIACVNVANLLLARAAGREREIAVRRALGANAARIVRLCLAEVLLVAALGAAGGALLARVGITLLAAANPAALPDYATPSLDGRALAFTAAVSLAVSALFGLAPAISAARMNWGARGTRPKRRAPAALIAIETALALVLLVTAGLLLKSFLRLERVDPGFRADHVLTMRLELSGPRYRDPQRRVAFLSELRQQLAEIPGVVSASGVSRLPVAAFGDLSARSGNPFSIEGRPWDPNGPVPQIAHSQTVALDYFGAMGIPLRAGRDFTASDTASSTPVTIVGETLARRWFPKGAIGQRILLGAPHPGAAWITIIGVVADVKTGALDQPAMPQFYTPAAQDAPSAMTVVVRTPAMPQTMARTAAAVIHRLDPELPVHRIETAEERVARSIGQPRYQSLLAGFFALAAMLLAAVGVYGVVANDTARRTRENAIRVALGAVSGRIVMTELARGLSPVIGGTILGAAGAAAATRLLASELFGVTPLDLATFAAAAAVLMIAGAAACLGPARRAATKDPLEALRQE